MKVILVTWDLVNSAFCDGINCVYIKRLQLEMLVVILDVSYLLVHWSN
jgi:hypothetical protein